jgi:hypothetical protein
MRRSSKNDRRNNALKHGAFAKELAILDESPEDFDELYSGCVQELKPSGRLEDEVVLDIARLIWRKRRIGRFFVEEAEWAQEHPDSKELRLLSFIYDMLEKGLPCQAAWQLISFLPHDCRETIHSEFSLPPTKFDDEWVGRLREKVEIWRTFMRLAINEKRQVPQFVGETAAKIRELTAKQMGLEDRVDLMIDRAIKRLAIVKTFKEVVVAQTTG